jgi:hypothetical protein
MVFPGSVPAPVLSAPKDLGEAVVVRANPVMTRILSEYYRSPLIPRAVSSGGVGKSTAGFFRFGTDIVLRRMFKRRNARCSGCRRF